MMDGTVRTVELESGRVLRIGTYELDPGDGDGPEARVFVSAGWRSTPPTPFARETVDLPAARVPELVEALEALEEAGER